MIPLRSKYSSNPIAKKSAALFIRYKCQHCGETDKLYSVLVRFADYERGIIEATKLGELPFFSSPVPPRLNSLVGIDRELFLKGRRAENSNLGIGAFSYYRR